MVKLLKQVRYLYFEKHKGSTGGLQGTTNANGQRHSNKNIKPIERKSNISETKDDRTWRAGGCVWNDLGAKAIRKDAVKMVETTVQLGAISPRKAKK